MKNTYSSNKPLKSKISITVDSDVLNKLRGMADYDARNVSQYINLVLKRHVEQFYNEEIHLQDNEK
jgi:hypothetical protein